MTELEQLERKLKERFTRAFATYHLLEDGDKILVGLSGGKDSLFLLEMLAKRAKINHPCFQVEAIHVRMENISYETSTEYIEHFCKELGVPLHIVSTSFVIGKDAFSPTESTAFTNKELRRQKTPCFLCSWNRRKQMFNLAQELGCNKIALGHHQDDLLRTALMNLTFQGRFDTMPALLRLRKMTLAIIRPLCFMEEKDIKRYAELRNYQKQVKRCPYEHETHRTDISLLYDNMQSLNPEARSSLWNALCRDGKLTEEAAPSQL